MRIGYPCINLTVGCKGDRTFRLKPYSADRLKATYAVDFDVMLEIKDKEKSAIKAVKLASRDSRFLKTIENWSGNERKE